MNKNNLVPGTIKGIQIVDLEKKLHHKNSSSKNTSLKSNIQRNNLFNTLINNDSTLILPKDNTSNKNIPINSKTKTQPHIIISSNNNNNKNVKSKGNINSKKNNRNIIKIKSQQKNNILPKPVNQKQKEILIYKEKGSNKLLINNSKKRKSNTQGSIIRNNSNSNQFKKVYNIKKMKSEPNSKRFLILNEKYENHLYNEENNPYMNEQKRKIKKVFRRILSMNTDMEQISFVNSFIPTYNFGINPSLDNINSHEEKKEYNNKSINNKKIIKKSKTNHKIYIISQDKINKDRNEDDIISKKSNIQINKIIKKNINHKNYNSNNRTNSLYLKCKNYILKLNNSNSSGNINNNDNYKNIRNLSNIKNSNNNTLNSTIVNICNKMNITFNNNIYRLNSLSKSKQNSKIKENKLLIITKRYNNSKNNDQKNKINNHINCSNKILNKKEIEYLNKSPGNTNIIMLHSNAINNINQNIIAASSSNNTKNKEKEINEEIKDSNFSSAMRCKKEIIKKVKIDNHKNRSSQKKRKTNNYNKINSNNNIKGNANVNKYKIVKKLSNNSNNNKKTSLKGNIKDKKYILLNEANNNSNISMNSIKRSDLTHNYLENIKNSNDSKIITSNNSCEELPSNKIISIKKITINNNISKIYDIVDNENLILNNIKMNKKEEEFFNKYTNSNIDKSFNIGKNINFNNSSYIIPINSNNNIIDNCNKTLNVNEKIKGTKKKISISCSIKNQKDKKSKKKVHRRQQSMINQGNNNNLTTKYVNINNFNISLKKKSLQTINIDFQNDSYIKAKNKIRYSTKKFFNKEEPTSAKNIIKKYKNYLKDYEIEELRQLFKDGEFVYYLGEINERINNKDITFSKKNQSFILNNKNINNQNRLSYMLNNKKTEKDIFLNRTINGFIKEKDENITKITKNFDQKNFDDEEGDYKLIIGGHLNYRYEMIECLGKGSFGEAIKCYDHKNNYLVCIKIINSQEKFKKQALNEIKILSTISTYDINNDSNNIQFYNNFIFRNHICLVFELLGKNLYEYLKSINFIGLDILQIKNYTTQILFSLLFLSNLNIIHCDLKPENILLYQNNLNQIKVIDFGSSCFESERIYSYIQSRFYRAPEVILDLGYNNQIDIWSLGCIIYELYTGSPLFPGNNEIEQIYLIMEAIGKPPLFLIDNSPKRRIFFDKILKTFMLKDDNKNIFKPGSKKIKDILKDSPNNFIDFINKCLLWNPLERLTPEKALLHPFIIENMNGPELYKHKLKIKHIKYGIQNYNNNINSTRNREYINFYQCTNNKEILRNRGNSCGTNRYNNKLNEVIYTKTVWGENDDINIKKNKHQNYSITLGNNEYIKIFGKKKDKKLPLPIDIDVNLRRINIT